MSCILAPLFQAGFIEFRKDGQQRPVFNRNTRGNGFFQDTFHKISPKHLQRYVSEFAGKHNVRDSGTLAQMRHTVARLVGRNLLYRDLIASNGLSSGAPV